MKTFFIITCLFLLALHMFGLSLAVLCMDYQYQSAETTDHPGRDGKIIAFSLPQNHETDYVDCGPVEGLFRIDDQLYNVTSRVQKDDTLFVIFQNNESAWQHFTVLSEIMQEVYSNHKASSPASHAIKLLFDFSKVYLSAKSFIFNNDLRIRQLLLLVIFEVFQCKLNQHVLSQDSPPPEV